MINIFEVNETNKMIEQENLDVRTITMGISLLDCIDPDLDALNQKIYEKITTKARNLVATGDELFMQSSPTIVVMTTANTAESHPAFATNFLIPV